MGGKGSGGEKFTERLPVLLNLMRQDATSQAIADHFNVTLERGRQLRDQVKKRVSVKKWKRDRKKRLYSYQEVMEELGISRDSLIAIIKKRGIAPSLRRGSKSTYMLTWGQLEEISKDPRATRITTCRFCGEKIVGYPNGGRLKDVCFEKACRRQYNQERYRKRFSKPFDPQKLKGKPRVIWEALNAAAVVTSGWIDLATFSEIAGVTKSQVIYLINLGVIRNQEHPTRVCRRTQKPAYLLSRQEAEVIAEVVNSEGP